MSGVAEKARFYLERAVPQLREWEEREIFSPEEIRTIVRKRNENEHRVLSPGNKPSEWSSYAQWEKSLESLRSKRCKRLKIRHLQSGHAGQGRVLTIYDRGVNRHPGSSTLWREYLNYIAGIQATKRWRKTMTNALRMMPTDPELWILAGRRAASNGDMSAARGFFMRGCRFCTKDCSLWIEYARAEMDWLVKVERRKKNAAQEGKSDHDPLRPDKANEDDELRFLDGDEEDSDNEDMLNGNGQSPLPKPSQEQAAVIDKQAAASLTPASNPALEGAIPIAIFDISQKQPFYTPEVAEVFFKTVMSYRHLPTHSAIAQHIISAMEEKYPKHPCTAHCLVLQPVLGLSPHVAEFPRQMHQVLAKFQDQIDKVDDAPLFRAKTSSWIDSIIAEKDLDEGIRTVLEYVNKQYGTETQA